MIGFVDVRTTEDRGLHSQLAEATAPNLSHVTEATLIAPPARRVARSQHRQPRAGEHASRVGRTEPEPGSAYRS